MESGKPVSTTLPEKNQLEADFFPRLPVAPRWALLSCIVVTIALIVWVRMQFNFRAGHMDEYDYLFLGRTLLSGANWPSHTYVFGSDWNWLLFGLGDKYLGGLTGARILAGMLGMLSLVGMYWFVRELWQSRSVALVATLLLALQAAHMFISRMATYDIVSFTCLVLALTPLLKVCKIGAPPARDRLRMLWLFVAIALLILASLSKYTTIAYLPLIAMVMVFRAPLSALTGVVVIGSVLSFYGWSHWDQLNVLYNVQISGVHGKNSNFERIFDSIAAGSGVLIVGWALAFCSALLFKIPHKNRVLMTLAGLLLFASPLIIYHVHGRNVISLYKHLNFANLFLIPGIAWMVVEIYRKMSRLVVVDFESSANASPAGISGFRFPLSSVAAVSCASLLIALLCLNFVQLERMQNGFPDMTRMMSEIETEFSESTKIISEDPYLFRYLAFGKLEQSQLKETAWFDNNRDGKATDTDIRQALWDRKFDFVLLTDQIHPQRNDVYRKILSQRGYEELFKEQYSLSSVMTGNQTGSVSLYRFESSEPKAAVESDVSEKVSVDGSAVAQKAE